MRSIKSLNPGSAGIIRDDPGMRLSRSQRRTGTRWPQRGSVGRVRLYNVTDDAVVDGSPVRLCWVGGRSRSGGRASAAPARSCGSSLARCARRRGVRRRCPGRCTVGRAARRGSRAPACGRWQGSIPVSDAPRTRRLTGVSRTWLSQNPGPPNLARETITRTPAATSPPARLTSPAPRP